MKTLIIAVAFLTVSLAAAAAGTSLDVSSGSFEDGGMIPQKHAFGSDNASPPIRWSGVPEGTKSIALICDDPDAPRGDWVHWVVFNIPASSTGLPEGVPKEEVLPDGSRQGVNDFKMIGYDGPAPPRGVHRYIFKVFALDSKIDLKPGCTKADLLGKMAGHILAEGTLMGRYESRS